MARKQDLPRGLFAPSLLHSCESGTFLTREKLHQKQLQQDETEIDEEEEDDDEDDEEAKIARVTTRTRTSVCRRKRSQQYNEPISKKIYLAFFISLTVVICFCIFVVIPQLIGYFTSSNALSSESSIYAAQKQSVIELLDSERVRRNKERLEIMRRFNSLQQNYKRLKIEYEKAREIYRKKLHIASQTENELTTHITNQETVSTNSSSDQPEFDLISKIANSSIVENSLNDEVPYHVVLT